ncbi:MAG: M28 family peptidase [Turicibacter sp.]|nr:M28 family peptidase [Turicibacter sp.]
MKKLLSLGVLLVLLVLQGCGANGEDANGAYDVPETTEPPVVEEATQPERGEPRVFDVAPGEHGYLGVQWLAHLNDVLPNRLAFSDRELETAEWLVETLLEIGFDESQIEVQTFRYDAPTSSWWGEPTWHIEWFEEMGYYDGLEWIYYSQNVILTVPGQSEETMIIGAHYDGVGYPGISDNASGIVLLLENAYRMRNIDHYYTLQYVFFGAEEVGLIGAFYFVDNMTDEEIDNLILMINADVMMDGPELIYAIAYRDEMPEFPEEIMWDDPEFSQNALTEQVESIAQVLNASGRTDLISRPHAFTLSTDQLAFIPFGIPVMVFYASHPVEYPFVFVGDVLHTADDCLDFLMENHPGRVEHALYGFGLFLEEILSSEFEQ